MYTSIYAVAYQANHDGCLCVIHVVGTGAEMGRLDPRRGMAGIVTLSLSKGRVPAQALKNARKQRAFCRETSVRGTENNHTSFSSGLRPPLHISASISASLQQSSLRFPLGGSKRWVSAREGQQFNFFFFRVERGGGILAAGPPNGFVEQ
ncbi:hypothetical protein K431DRAFT_60825 [Polychaeton citri CBS 116435]|uniref:Uncharacterized protein n=1 Tax=Polychaeton citri CBS 116435 TaxID=1314669 RepID=A0A9P4URJ6_9PEZI|nr:hypothetical protein K431DRAFT_60825 [Polychaeton citri CBS 116435]